MPRASEATDAVPRKRPGRDPGVGGVVLTQPALGSSGTSKKRIKSSVVNRLYAPPRNSRPVGGNSATIDSGAVVLPWAGPRSPSLYGLQLLCR